MIWLKGAHQKSAKFQTFDCSRKVSPNFDRVLLLKVYKISAKEVQRIYVSWHWHDPKFEERLMLFQKWQEFGEFWPDHRKASKICFSIGSFLYKIYVWLKKYRGVIFHDIEEWCKVWRKTYVLLGKWHEKFCKFSSEHSKVSKLKLW